MIYADFGNILVPEDNGKENTDREQIPKICCLYVDDNKINMC